MESMLHTDICRILGITYPVLLAGMAGGPTTPELVAAVSKAGGLGTFGAAYMEPEAIRQAIRRVRELTDQSFAVNLFAVDLTDDTTHVREMQAVLDPLREQLGIEPGAQNVRTADRFAEQLNVLFEEQVPVISTAFGLLSAEAMQRAHDAGIKVIAMATTVKEAMAAEKHGVHIVVAQGSDAGGHRGTWDTTAHPMGANIGTFSLVPQMVDAVHIPVVAAGGIMDGRGLAAALMLGASGVQLGTRFLTAAESGAHPVYQRALLGSTEEDTVITRAFSGRPARGVRNAFIEHVESSEMEPLSFPTQNTVTGDIRRAAAAQNNEQYMSLWAGQATRMLTDQEEASSILTQIVTAAGKLLEK
ncbi:NAD(P)H-dependent flavin oxidoreductase [Aneurinibacillus uraniidurans]|uniref:NAD(P)H-dependent flavin oxidoreductase n=1 Tax=Aneurinibacillus uraniidurans TaxID=2966586 RepID=UPI00234A6E9D|nr:nitronate monooxygenase [Aneurinibacillus sp. B1]WCN38813.1 nitronate monooxygenase [Aneurinibacillus sp. B1]